MNMVAVSRNGEGEPRAPVANAWKKKNRPNAHSIQIIDDFMAFSVQF